MLEKILKHNRITFLYKTPHGRNMCYLLASIISKYFNNVMEFNNDYYDKYTIKEIIELSNDDNIILIRDNFRVFSAKNNRYESIIDIYKLKNFINITDIGTSVSTFYVSDLVISVKDSIFTIEKIRYCSIPNINHFSLDDIKMDERKLKIKKLWVV
jgi:hypothetical protein